MGDFRLIRPQSSLSLLLIFKREKRKGDAVILETFSIRFFSLQSHVVGISNFSKAFVYYCLLLFFVIRSASLFSPKKVNNSLRLYNF